jgi:NTE family protein
VKFLDISADTALARHPLTSKMNTEKNFLDNLFQAGREMAGLVLAD